MCDGSVIFRRVSKLDVKTLGATLDKELDRQTISASTLLSTCRVIDEDSRKSAPYVDHRYIPFYYYLGKHIQPKTMLDFGFRLGLFSSCFFRGCHTVDNFLAFQHKDEEFYSSRLGTKNVMDHFHKKIHVYVGNVTDDSFLGLLRANTWDLAVINEEVSYEEHRLLLDLIWPHISLGGLVVMDYIDKHQPAREIFYDFCKVHKCEPVKVKSRYGVGLIEK